MNILKDIVRGIMIGIANIIPGVSGGTMMVSMGIYDKIIGSITNLFKHFMKSVKTLLPYAIGMGVGIVGLSFFIEKFFSEYPLPTAMAFIGLIFGGLPIMLRKVKGKTLDPIGIVLFLIFFALIIVLEFVGDNEGSKNLELGILEAVKLLVVGIIAAATMVIPGVSGSMVLLALGYYSPILQLVNGTIIALKDFNINQLVNNGLLLAPFCIGVLIGIFAIAKIIEYLLKCYERRTYFAILGLVVASPFAVLMGMQIRTVTISSVLVGAITFGIGFLVAFYLGKEK